MLDLEDNEENREIITYDDIEDLPEKEKLNLMYECDLKPYLRSIVSIDIFNRECFVNISHMHKYVILQAIFPKTNFNYTCYKDVNAIVNKILSAYYDKLLQSHKAQTVNFYFRTRDVRAKAYDILAAHNFYYPYGKDNSLTQIDQDQTSYMMELLEHGGIDTAQVFTSKT